MPLLHYSNHLESLILPLSQELEKRDPFECAEIVVPNYSLKKWISLKLAQINGIVANLRFITLEKAIYEGLQNELRELNYDLLKKENIQCLLQETLREKFGNSDPLWLPIKKYLSPRNDISPQAKEFRFFQLSKRLTYLFLEYEYSRNDELINSWMKGKNAIDFDPLGTESWQKQLWLELFGKEGKVAKHNREVRKHSEKISHPELYTLTQLYRLCCGNTDYQDSKIIPQNINTKKIPLHFFGISYLSKFHQEALSIQLSKFREIKVYALNPCMEFWEDVQSFYESKAEIIQSIESKCPRFTKQKIISEKEILFGETSQIENDNPFLQAWGRPGRENIRLLNQWSDWDFTPWFVEKSFSSKKQTPKVLNQLQQDILLRESRREKPLEMAQDDSLIVLACSNPRREVEAVASLIWDWILSEPDLMLNDCALIVNDMDLYQHEIEHVFESTHNLPFHLIDGDRGIASRLEEAASSLLELCFTDYTRQDLFNLINNPFFLRIFEDFNPAVNDNHVEILQIEKWLEWADELNIFFGIDNDWYKSKGYESFEYDIHSWEHAFHRLALGNMMTTQTNTEFFSVGGKRIVPANLSQEWSLEAARFTLIIRSLIADTRNLPKWEMSGKNWARYLHILLKTYLNPCGQENDEAFQNLLMNALSIRDLDFGHEKDHLFCFNTIIEYFKQKQTLTTLHRGHYLAEGITVSSFQPMRPIPFKAVFLLGLGEGMFPTPYQRDTLDLRHFPEKINPAVDNNNFRERRIGDVSETERDRYMFLETLISTREHLVLSYVSHNDRTDDELSPSSIIQTLIDELDKGYLKNKFRETKHPLKTYSLDYFPELKNFERKHCTREIKLPNYDLIAFSQARSIKMRELIDQNRTSLQSIPSELIPSEISDSIKNKFLPTKNLVFDPIKKTSLISTSSLRKFLESPLQASVSNIIKFNEKQVNMSDKITEPFILERLNEWSLLRKIWDKILTTQIKNNSQSNIPDWNNTYRLYLKRMELEGLLPSGIFKKAMQEKHIKILNNWKKQLTVCLKTDWPNLQRNLFQFHLGSVEEGVFNSEITNNHKLKPAVDVQVNTNSSLKTENYNTKIRGSTEWWYAENNSNWYVIFLNETPIKEKYWLRHFLDIIILRLADVFPDNIKVKALCIGPDSVVKSREIKIPSKLYAEEYLANLLKEMNNEDAGEFMPIESVFDLSKENLNESNYNKRFIEWMDSKIKNSKKNLGISSKYGPVNFLEDAPYPENPYIMMRRRFKLFFETILVSSEKIL